MTNKIHADSQTILSKQSIGFWKELFIYFWVFSLVGHYLEIIGKSLILPSRWHSIMSTIMPFAPPYGIGVVAVILLVKPLIRKYNLNPLIVFGLCTIVSGVVEYICAAVLVLLVGYNKFWNYSNEPFNINGYICLQSEIIFGILITIFLYFIYPLCNKFFRKLKNISLILYFG